jgi:hypothetical protein
MICDCCRREVDYVRASFWHGDARLCRECFAQWCSPDCDQFGSGGPMSVGNYVRLRHGLPPLAAAMTILMLAGTTACYASRHCLDHVEAARIWPARTLVQNGDGCWTHTHLPPSGQVPNLMPEPLMITGKMRPEYQPQPEPLVTMGRFVLFVSAVMAATVSALEAWRPQSNPPGRASIRERSW